MRRIIGSAFLSLDGVMQAPGGPTEDPTGGFAHGGWVFGFFDEEVGAAVGAFFDRPYDLLLGRRTYDIFASYWPYVSGEEAAMGDAFTRAGKHVLTRGGARLDWANSHPLADMAAVAALKRTNGPDLLIQGSGTIYDGLLEHRLLDRLTTLTFPLLLGRGKRLFGEATPPGALRLVDHKVTRGGVRIDTYEPAGPVAAGAGPAPEQPSPREEERRRAIAQGRW